MRAAVIGAGPSGFFTAGELLKRYPGGEVHLFERRIAPYGLVRFGVAPDHALTRRVIKQFDQIADSPRFHYHGNIEVGRDLSLDELGNAFHAVFVCTGAEKARRPDIPGAGLPGVADALDLARWVNGEPEAFVPGWLRDVETALIIGNGNVAIDIARMLARPSADWTATDMAPHAMEALMHHRVRRIIIAGRRGPADASFSEAELEELVLLPHWTVRPHEPLPFGLVPDKPETGHVLEFRFHWQLASLRGSDRVTGARFTSTVTGEADEIPVQLVLFATGHTGIPIAGLPFDRERGIIPNEKGAIPGMPGWYACGWIKRGAKGLIGHNRKDALETVGRMAEDVDALLKKQIAPVAWRTELLARGARPVSWTEWRKISDREVQRGAAVGRPRINLAHEEALSVLDSSAGAAS